MTTQQIIHQLTEAVMAAEADNNRELVIALKLAIARYQTTQWHPIATAPRGTTILIARWREGEIVWITSGKIYPELHLIVIDATTAAVRDHGYFSASHWMPAPDAPTQDGEMAEPVCSDERARCPNCGLTWEIGEQDRLSGRCNACEMSST
jgi:hypothetical protein